MTYVTILAINESCSISFTGDCRHNSTVYNLCGDGNDCMGSMEDWHCVCNSNGWKPDDMNTQTCIRSKKIFRDFSFIMRNPNISINVVKSGYKTKQGLW